MIKRLDKVMLSVVGKSAEEAVAAAEADARKCGRCTACCTVLGVDEINKPHMKKCEHEKTHKGCSIYATKPAQCSNFMCLWKMGFGARKDAPDQIGIVVDVYQNDSDESVLRVSEVWKGALAAPRASAFVSQLRPGAKYIQVSRPDGTQEMGTITKTPR